MRDYSAPCVPPARLPHACCLGGEMPGEQGGLRQPRLMLGVHRRILAPRALGNAGVA